MQFWDTIPLFPADNFGTGPPALFFLRMDDVWAVGSSRGYSYNNGMYSRSTGVEYTGMGSCLHTNGPTTR